MPTSQNPLINELRFQALVVLGLTEPAQKVLQTRLLQEQVLCGQFSLDTEVYLTPEPAIAIPGRPARPELVPPLQVRRRSMNTLEGRAALLHALSHIEFNAINLALDAIWRFAGMPAEYYLDWLKVAAEEALHFNLLSEHLITMGYHYGDFTGHDTLWEMVAKTQEDVLARMALVPRTMEARGLDAAPSTRNKLHQVGDEAGAAIIDLILRDEIGHVAIGNRWFGHLCRQRNLDPIDCYADLTLRYKAPKLRAPFNMEARRAAGFSEDELQILLDIIDAK
jgi:uncharacterized ferritin-like protein (DUF455 family)